MVGTISDTRCYNPSDFNSKWDFQTDSVLDNAPSASYSVLYDFLSESVLDNALCALNSFLLHPTFNCEVEK